MPLDERTFETIHYEELHGRDHRENLAAWTSPEEATIWLAVFYGER
ncbi:MAG: hypothetical protein IT427_09385 [Pirellulales bacterium]|nr:hypothetical protein [Pirellulales bacterium]